jgi:uncharacterized protein
MLAWRLLLATGDPDAADVLERTIYNGVLSGVSHDGTRFFYVNPLQRRTHRVAAAAGTGERAAWYACACCPPNLGRILAGWPQCLATTDAAGIQVHQYATGELIAATPGGPARLAVATGYPWDGRVELTVVETPEVPWTLSLRVPGWTRSGRVTLPGSPAASIAAGERSVVTRRAWRAGDVVTLELDLPGRITEPAPPVDAIRGCVALERGPLVYCVETADLPSGIELEDVTIVPSTAPETEPRPDVGDGVVGLAATGRTDGGAGVPIRAIPYHAWANRSVAAMRVWIPGGGDAAGSGDVDGAR